MIKSLKIISVNFFIFIILLVIIELLFGYWFDKNNLGPYVREHRLRKTNYITTFENKKYNFIFYCLLHNLHFITKKFLL